MFVQLELNRPDSTMSLQNWLSENPMTFANAETKLLAYLGTLTTLSRSKDNQFVDSIFGRIFK